ncbi:hypothetical protein ACFPVT_02750 [Corynebacterium choanae]|uniref:Uncharacterized protein n=1 Tax=Corynebacterium choanae TaxID=1862358 RepID=A0A3G6J4Y2_9CORY|nr:hypothetical protein [Corynebacterium choanae]AZA12999.1 hypothetical protein CCHOA_02915 [Corynebacterium choanae]
MVTAAAEATSSDSWLIYLLFIAAGFLVGGAWAAWQQRIIWLTVVTAVVAAIVAGVALTWLIGEVA